MKPFSPGKTSLVISIVVAVLGICSISTSGMFTSTMMSEDQSTISSVISFLFLLIAGGMFTVLAFVLPAINLVGGGMGLLSLVEKREEKTYALLGVAINGMLYLVAFIFHLISLCCTGIVLCAFDLVEILVLIPVFILIYRKRNKPADTKIEPDVNQSA